MAVDADKVIYADWRIRKVVCSRGKLQLSTSDTLFKDFFYHKSRPEVTPSQQSPSFQPDSSSSGR